MMKDQGCNKAVSYSVLPTDKFNYYSCPGSHKDSNYLNLLQMFKVYDAGINPYGGSIIDIPNKFVEIYQVVYNLQVEHSKEIVNGQ